MFHKPFKKVYRFKKNPKIFQVLTNREHFKNVMQNVVKQANLIN